ncbi:MAG: response regulator [Chlamydiae bacterium]|nr:response regulator [Chlamydiota bacterium]
MTLLKILVVDDEKDIRTIITASLESQEGFEVKCVSSGEEALREAPIFQPDLILLDYIMPLMNGEATFKALQCIPSLTQVPVILLTGSSSPEKFKSLLSLGIAEVIVKPFDPWTLPLQIQSVLSRYREKHNLGK